MMLTFLENTGPLRKLGAQFRLDPGHAAPLKFYTVSCSSQDVPSGGTCDPLAPPGDVHFDHINFNEDVSQILDIILLFPLAANMQSMGGSLDRAELSFPSVSRI